LKKNYFNFQSFLTFLKVVNLNIFANCSDFSFVTNSSFLTGGKLFSTDHNKSIFFGSISGVEIKLMLESIQKYK